MSYSPRKARFSVAIPSCFLYTVCRSTKEEPAQTPDIHTMNTRKKLKELGRRSLKKHYTVFVAACLIAAFLGAEFKSSLDFASAQKRRRPYRNLSGTWRGISRPR